MSELDDILREGEYYGLVSADVTRVANELARLTAESKELREKLAAAKAAQEMKALYYKAGAEHDAKELAEARRLLHEVDVIMDVAAIEGVRAVLAPAYAEHWADVHTRVRASLPAKPSGDTQTGETT